MVRLSLAGSPQPRASFGAGGAGSGEAIQPVGDQRAAALDRVVGVERRARNELVGLLALFLVTLAVSVPKGQDIFVFAYIMTVVVAITVLRTL